MPPGELISAAEHLRTKVRAYRVAHLAAGDHLRAFHYLLGFALIAMSALVSGSVLQSTEGNPSKSLTLTTGILSTLVVILTAIQTTFKLGERGEAHRSAADGFGRIDRRLEIFVHRNHPDLPKAWDELGAISVRLLVSAATALGQSARGNPAVLSTCPPARIVIAS